MVSSAEEISSNLDALRKIHSKANEVINAAKKRTNEEISKETGLHVTLVSRILNRAKSFEFVEKKNNRWFKTKKIKGYNLKRMSINKSLTKNNNLPNNNYHKKPNKEFKKNYESEFLLEANKNTQVYVNVYVIENILRKIIFEAFGKEKKWWKEEFVSKDVFKHAEDIRIAESKHPWIKKRGDHPLYYVGLEELKKIITKHWENNFKWIGNKEKFFPWIDELIPIRNMVAHNVSLEKEEINITEIKSKWLITLINNQKDENTNKTTQ